ncbi:hypothetical protein O7635_15185 [Asanoa sp. WMMD1127]|uniref:hypothetical protein n=1 Tax=Asanoa sp. WMMD1127 TaxID=3016107 RepID=UPI0024173AFD|nr:hypothetical protein [Asanoa sp. WMMD1127]MDG4823199.1 hypothetical protein [Asanoa sp. WMMD1127]
MIRRGLLVLGILAALLLAACGVRPTVVINGGPAPAGTVAGLRLYLVADGETAVVTRVAKPADATSALRLLAAGPTPEEAAAGLTTEVPAGLGPAKVGYQGDSTIVTVATDVRALSVLAVMQIVCTVQATTAYAPVTLVNGEQRRGPLTCPADF